MSPPARIEKVDQNLWDCYRRENDARPWFYLRRSEVAKHGWEWKIRSQAIVGWDPYFTPESSVGKAVEVIEQQEKTRVF